MHYEAGFCNIGKSEVNYRKRVVGYGAATVGAALYVILVFFNFPLVFYGVLFIPVFISTHGFIEAKNRFCTTYAKAGKYNIANEVGITQDVISQGKRDKDRAYAKRLTVKSIKISVVITAVLIGLSRFMN